jgi:ribosomal protein L40E
MEKYKVCSTCGAQNSPGLFECIECETDLTSVRVVDTETEKLSQSNISETMPQDKKVRVCECGAQNLTQARKCTVCGEDISDIPPSVISETREVCEKFELKSLDRLCSYKITCPVTLIGREQEMKEYLDSKHYVSRNHAKITLVNGEVYINNLSNTNFTFVNNQKITNDSPYKLNDGDEIGLGGMLKDGNRQQGAAYFTMRINSCM